MLSKLTITVVEARSLEAKDSNGYSDPYCWVHAPDGTRCKTRTIYKNLNPLWDETFEFEVDISDPSAEVLFQLWDYDRFASDDFLGRCTISIPSLVGKPPSSEWIALEPRPGKKESVSGQIYLTLWLRSLDDNGLDGSNLMVAKEKELRFVDMVDAKTLASLSKEERKRQEIIFELINTEQQYVDDLNIIISTFLHNIRKKSLLSATEIASVFSNVEALVPVNEKLLLDLKARQKESPVVSRVGNILCKHVDAFNAYTVYCSNQSIAADCVEEYRSSDRQKEFSAFLDAPKSECRNLPIQGFLVKPLQRLCKYPLLVRELLKETPTTHPDYNDLIEFEKKIKMVVHATNEQTREVEGIHRIKNIQNLLSAAGFGNIIKEGRRVMLEAKVTFVVDEKKTYTDALAILFSDMLMVGKQKAAKIDVICTLMHHLMDIEEVGNGMAIRITTSESNYILEMSSLEEKRVWYSKMNDQKISILYDMVRIVGEGTVAADPPSEKEMRENPKIVRWFTALTKETGLRRIAEEEVKRKDEQIHRLEAENSMLQAQISHHMDEHNHGGNIGVDAHDPKKGAKSPMVSIDRLRSDGFIMRKKQPIKKQEDTKEKEKEPLKKRSSSKGSSGIDRLKSDGNVLREKREKKLSKSMGDSLLSAHPAHDAKELERERERRKRDKKKLKRALEKIDHLSDTVSKLEEENERLEDLVTKKKTIDESELENMLKEKMTEREKRLEEEMNSMAEETEELRLELLKLRKKPTEESNVSKSQDKTPPRTVRNNRDKRRTLKQMREERQALAKLLEEAEAEEEKTQSSSETSHVLSVEEPSASANLSSQGATEPSKPTVSVSVSSTSSAAASPSLAVPSSSSSGLSPPQNRDVNNGNSSSFVPPKSPLLRRWPPSKHETDYVPVKVENVVAKRWPPAAVSSSPTATSSSTTANATKNNTSAPSSSPSSFSPSLAGSSSTLSASSSATNSSSGPAKTASQSLKDRMKAFEK